MFLRLYSCLKIFTSQNTPTKIIGGLWKRYGISQSYFFCLKYMLRFSTKLLIQLSLPYLLLFLKLYSVLIMFSPQKHPKIVTGPLNGYGIVWIGVCPEYLLRFPTKLSVKLHFRDFEKILRLCSRFTIFIPKKATKPQKPSQIS